MEKKIHIMKPRYSEQIVPVPWPFDTSRFHCTFRDLFLFLLESSFLNYVASHYKLLTKT